MHASHLDQEGHRRGKGRGQLTSLRREALCRDVGGRRRGEGDVDAEVLDSREPPAAVGVWKKSSKFYAHIHSLECLPIP
jgi:hypothetical protein